MLKVDQEIIILERGDCMRAVIASLFELEIIQVPHFYLFSKETWFDVYHCFIWGMGYRWMSEEKKYSLLKDQETVNGGISASVPSKNFRKGIYHNVVINNTGLVIHDPHPTKSFQNINIIETKELLHWCDIRKREKEF